MIVGKYGRKNRNSGQPITFWVSDEEKVRLTQIAQARKCGISQLVREVVRVSLLDVSDNFKR